MSATLKITYHDKNSNDSDSSVWRLPLDAENEITFTSVDRIIQKIWLGLGARHCTYIDEDGDVCTLTESTFADFLANTDTSKQRKVFKLELSGTDANKEDDTKDHVEDDTEDEDHGTKDVKEDVKKELKKEMKKEAKAAVKEAKEAAKEAAKESAKEAKKEMKKEAKNVAKEAAKETKKEMKKEAKLKDKEATNSKDAGKQEGEASSSWEHEYVPQHPHQDADEEDFVDHDGCCRGDSESSPEAKLLLQMLKAMREAGELSSKMVATMTVNWLPFLTERAIWERENMNLFATAHWEILKPALLALKLRVVCTPGLEFLEPQIEEMLNTADEKPELAGIATAELFVRLLQALQNLSFDAQVSFVEELHSTAATLWENLIIAFAELGWKKWWNAAASSPMTPNYMATDPTPFVCSGCGVSPISGLRFTCKQCSDYTLCNDCYEKKDQIHANMNCGSGCRPEHCFDCTVGGWTTSTASPPNTTSATTTHPPNTTSTSPTSPTPTTSPPNMTQTSNHGSGGTHCGWPWMAHGCPMQMMAGAMKGKNPWKPWFPAQASCGKDGGGKAMWNPWAQMMQGQASCGKGGPMWAPWAQMMQASCGKGKGGGCGSMCTPMMQHGPQGMMQHMPASSCSQQARQGAQEPEGANMDELEEKVTQLQDMGFSMASEDTLRDMLLANEMDTMKVVEQLTQ